MRSFLASAGRVFERLRDRRWRGGEEASLRERAAEAIARYADEHAAVFDRAARFRERAERLDREGTPSESIRNRAERAEREIAEGITALRSSFVSATGARGRQAFDKELSLRYPQLRLPDGRSG